jgi:hypothetical protein
MVNDNCTHIFILKTWREDRIGRLRALTGFFYSRRRKSDGLFVITICCLLKGCIEVVKYKPIATALLHGDNSAFPLK